jgi:CBS domain containing-hemolysin-like protein
MTTAIIIILVALLGEAFFSGAETAFVSVNFLKLMHLIEKKNKRAVLVHDLLKRPERLLITTLLGTNLSVVVSAACATAIFERTRPGYGALLATVIMTPISFVFCQLLPKTIFRYRANKMALYVAKPLSISEKVLLPFVSFFTFFGNSVARIVNPKGLRKNPFLTKDEIKSLIKDISREGILEAREKEAIDRIFEMTQTYAADIMVPMKNLVGIDHNDSIEAVKEKARTCRFTRFPVFKDKELAGIINIFDIFYNTVSDWRVLIRPIIRVAHNESVDKVFSKMQPNKELIVAVYNENDMAGILTLDDLMEDITSGLTAAKK